MLQRRMARPVRVIRGSSRSLKSGPAPSFWLGRFPSAPTIMERNLYMTKVRPPSPTRRCENNTGPRSSNQISAPVTTKIGSASRSMTDAATRSKAALAKRRPPENVGDST